MSRIQLLGLFAILYCANLSNAFRIDRIVGGTETTVEKRPYQASLVLLSGLSYRLRCGASIISTKYLMSAAHCKADLTNLYVRVGSSVFTSGGQVSKVGSYEIHPSYNPSYLEYDFGIVSVVNGQEFVLGPTVAIIPLVSSTGTDPVDGSLVVVSGWGATSDSPITYPTNLREANIPVVNEAICRNTYPFVTRRHMCLGGTPQGQLSACFGDSGGPVVQNGVQYALVSGGDSCTLPNIPGLYARISSVRGWITDITGI